jgi:2-polyprenyl-6-methoxyphenol hydroxylase-like FAD-dependent oxidoreductase
MNILVVGAGPAGLAFAAEADRSSTITVIERARRTAPTARCGPAIGLSSNP